MFWPTNSTIEKLCKNELSFDCFARAHPAEIDAANIVRAITIRCIVFFGQVATQLVIRLQIRGLKTHLRSKCTIVPIHQHQHSSPGDFFQAEPHNQLRPYSQTLRQKSRAARSQSVRLLSSHRRCRKKVARGGARAQRVRNPWIPRRGKRALKERQKFDQLLLTRLLACDKGFNVKPASLLHAAGARCLG